ncbi:MAG: hypothetical protein RIC87_03575, partial [Kiloniellales bacterium]
DTIVFAAGLENGTFDYIKGKAFQAAGNSEARHAGQGQIEVDSDGDGTADLAFVVDGMLQAAQLTATDFLWM